MITHAERMRKASRRRVKERPRDREHSLQTNHPSSTPPLSSQPRPIIIIMDYFIVEKLMFSPHQINIIDLVVRISASLGMLGSLFMIVTFILFRAIREFSTKLICLLAVSDFMVYIPILSCIFLAHMSIIPLLLVSFCTSRIDMPAY
jgi:hypothetical protein